MREENTLECGRSIDSVWESLDLPLDNHQRHCEYCTSARKSLLKVMTLTREATAADKALEIKPDTKIRIMDFAHKHVRRGPDIPIYEDSSATLSVSQRLITQLVQQTVDEFDGLTMRRTVVHPIADDEAGIRSVDLNTSLVITPGARFPLVESELRRRIMTTIRERIGVTVRRLTLQIEDVQFDEID